MSRRIPGSAAGGRSGGGGGGGRCGGGLEREEEVALEQVREEGVVGRCDRRQRQETRVSA